MKGSSKLTRPRPDEVGKTQNSKVRKLVKKIQATGGILQCVKGFTLIELLVSVAILAIVAGVGVTVFLSVTQSYTKAGIINNLRYEGSRVMEDLSRVIRSGTNLEASASTLTVTIDRESLEFNQNGSCETAVFQLDGVIGYNDRIRKSLSNCDETAVGAGVITDDDLVTGVNVRNLVFTVTDGGTVRPDRVDISLTLEEGLFAPNRQEYTAEVVLTNSVSTRRY
ncbi:prepilin-type N-terminal cleavage/methylation domain-containing protein [Patescibacteria group bacterium]|nr:prepilin-type N-terminal cleavage/methylation domain-containing protein [Patescibacteria group bacterium]MBU1868550.1 prepilin-type N-terminal cleavage/methylation domain-containing protein [Patescibacteria group bacterium]